MLTRHERFFMKLKLFLLIIAIFTFNSSVFAELKTVDQPKTVQDIYPDLTSGALSLAVLKDLPDGVLLKAGDIEIGSELIVELIDSQPVQSREELKKNAFFILEQEATNRILLDFAKKTLALPDKESPNQTSSDILQQFFEKEVFKKIEVTDQELKTFYENNKDICGGATMDQISSSLREYLISLKKQKMASDYIQTLGNRVSIQVSSDWAKKQALMAFDNAVDKARQSKKPSLVDFGASGCRPCDMMSPILKTLGTKYEGKLNVIFIHVREQQILASRYGIQSIPVQVFFDKDGKEVFRHTGFFAQEEIEKKLKEIGVQ
ncbi:MAG: thioredoxin [Candidatus Brocadiia bacterium]|nr:MAG: thioredoxin [Candidatus Brocadiia bacterium]